jgi:methyl-CpG-binding domain protein 4
LRQAAKNKKPRWVAPRSPHDLVEESIIDNPWGILVATIFLNKTKAFKAKPLLDKFLEDYPDPRSVLAKRPEDLDPYFAELGLKKRALQTWRMSHDYVHKPWRSVRELFGIGRYGEDAFRIFCLGDFSVEPQDRVLKIYHAWYLLQEQDNSRPKAEVTTKALFHAVVVQFHGRAHENRTDKF